jgi:hypothetical protein
MDDTDRESGLHAARGIENNDPNRSVIVASRALVLLLGIAFAGSGAYRAMTCCAAPTSTLALLYLAAGLALGIATVVLSLRLRMSVVTRLAAEVALLGAAR